MADDSEQTVEQKPADDSDASVAEKLKSSPETVRERSAKHRKLQEAAADRKRGPIRAFFYGFSWPLRKLSRLIAKLGRFKVFRIIGYILYPVYFRNSVIELRQVTWPDFRTTWRLVYAVIVFSVVFGVIIFGVDFGLDKLFKEIILKK